MSRLHDSGKIYECTECVLVLDNCSYVSCSFSLFFFSLYSMVGIVSLLCLSVKVIRYLMMALNQSDYPSVMVNNLG